MKPNPTAPAAKPLRASNICDDDEEEEKEKEKNRKFQWIEGPSAGRKNEIKDSEIDVFLIRSFARKLSKFVDVGNVAEEEESGINSSSRTRSLSQTITGRDFKKDVGERCRKIVRMSSSKEEQVMIGMSVIESIIPDAVARAFGTFLRLFPEWFAKRHAAFVTPLIMNWLVGESRVNDIPVEYCDLERKVPANAFDAAFGTKKDLLVGDGYMNGVLVTRCRVLEESGCVSVCQNVCKIPTEKFFADKVGLAVTLIPNYETFECQFCYGRVPTGFEGEEAKGCLTGCLASANVLTSCSGTGTTTTTTTTTTAATSSMATSSSMRKKT